MHERPCLKGWLWDASVGTKLEEFTGKKQLLGIFLFKQPSDTFSAIRMTLRYFYVPICHVRMTWQFDQFTQWSSGIWPNLAGPPAKFHGFSSFSPLVSLMQLSNVPFESMVIWWKIESNGNPCSLIHGFSSFVAVDLNPPTALWIVFFPSAGNLL